MTIPTNANIKVIAGRSLTFQCVTSGGVPNATVRWFKDGGNPGSSDDEQLVGSRTETFIEEYVVVTTSQLLYTPSIQDQNQRIFCVANNTEVVFESDLQPTLDVQCKFHTYVLLYLFV